MKQEAQGAKDIAQAMCCEKLLHTFAATISVAEFVQLSLAGACYMPSRCGQIGQCTHILSDRKDGCLS